MSETLRHLLRLAQLTEEHRCCVVSSSASRLTLPLSSLLGNGHREGNRTSRINEQVLGVRGKLFKN